MKRRRDWLKDVRNRLIHISRCSGITRRILRKMLHFDRTLRKIYQLSPIVMSELFHFPIERATKFHHDLHSPQTLNLLYKEQKQLKIITIVDENYPDMLKRIKDAPLVLYAKGNLNLLKNPFKISIIGTRNPSKEAYQKTRHYVQPLVSHGWLIVSGLARGIDRFAHEITLDYGGQTIAILGSGFHHPYPKENFHLLKKIVQKGLVLTEYPPHCPPAKFHFPERNRIISGLSLGTLVVEATEKSGTFITVDHALDQGRDVYVVPGPPNIPQTRGCHRLIQEGAKLVIDVNDILEEWNNSIGWLRY